MSATHSVTGHAFISYVREDASKASQLQDQLEAAAIKVWRDTSDISPGQDWRVTIKRAIERGAFVFIACFSTNSSKRLSSYQNEELALAAEQLRLRQLGETWLIPVRFDDCDIPHVDIGGGRSLASLQSADLFGQQRVENSQRLISTVLDILSGGEQDDRPSNSRRRDQGRFIWLTESANDDDAPYIGDVNLVAVSNRFELAEKLKVVYIRADLPTARILRERAKADGTTLSKEAIKRMLRGDRLPRKAAMLAFLRACGVRGDDLAPWRRAWELMAPSEYGQRGTGVSSLLGPPGTQSSAWTTDSRNEGKGPHYSGASMATDEVTRLRDEVKDLRLEIHKQLSTVERRLSQSSRLPSSVGISDVGDILSDEDGHGRTYNLSGRLVLDNRWVLYSRLEDADIGGGGIVWRAKDLRGGPNWLVVKTAPAGSVAMDTVALLQNLGMRNDQRAQDILSPYIGEIIASGVDQEKGLAYIVSPLYVPGSLFGYCSRERAGRSLVWCTRIVTEIMRGLIDASRHGLLHLDIKPANVVLDGAQVRIIDWGLSRTWNADQPYTGIARGTPFFASPEQLTRPPAWDTPLADLFGVGATFYWLLTDEPPLLHEAGGNYDMFLYRELLTNEAHPQFVHDLVPAVPKALSDLIDRWISLNSADRVPEGTPAAAAMSQALGELESLSWSLPDPVVGKVTGRRQRRHHGREGGMARKVEDE